MSLQDGKRFDIKSECTPLFSLFPPSLCSRIHQIGQIAASLVSILDENAKERKEGEKNFSFDLFADHLSILFFLFIFWYFLSEEDEVYGVDLSITTSAEGNVSISNEDAFSKE